MSTYEAITNLTYPQAFGTVEELTVPQNGSGTLPVCLFNENLHRLVTLWDVLRLFADGFVKLLHDLACAELESSGAIATSMTADRIVERLRAIGAAIAELERDCNKLRLKSAVKQVRNIKEWLSSKPKDFDEFSLMLGELRRRVTEDLEDAVVLCVEPSKIDRFYTREVAGELKGRLVRLAPETMWGHEVCSNFKAAISDISHAGDCLIVGEGTACVFHLMRVMEVGLRALGKSLNDARLDPRTNPSWDSILKRCDDELKLPYAKRSTEWQIDPSFFSEATANLRAVKDAWRNPTMHVEKNYEYDDALDVWNAVRAFMRHLGTRLHE